MQRLLNGTFLRHSTFTGHARKVPKVTDSNYNPTVAVFSPFLPVLNVVVAGRSFCISAQSDGIEDENLNHERKQDVHPGKFDAKWDAGIRNVSPANGISLSFGHRTAHARHSAAVCCSDFRLASHDFAAWIAKPFHRK